MAVATIRAARQLPRRNNSTATTSNAPSKRFVVTVVCCHRTNRPVYQIFPVVFLLDNDACRQLFLNLVDFFGNTLSDSVTVLAHQHHRDTKHGLLTAMCRCAGTKCVPDLNVSQVFDAHRHHTGRKLYWKLSNFLRRDDSADATDNELFIAGIDDPAAGVLDVFTDDFGQVVYGQAGVAQLGDMWLHHNLLYVTPIRVDLGNAGHSSQLRFDHVFLYLPQLHQLGFA